MSILRLVIYYCLTLARNSIKRPYDVYEVFMYAVVSMYGHLRVHECVQYIFYTTRHLFKGANLSTSDSNGKIIFVLDRSLTVEGYKLFFSSNKARGIIGTCKIAGYYSKIIINM